MPKNVEISVNFLTQRHRFENAAGDVLIASATLLGDDNKSQRITIKGTEDETEPFYPHLAYVLYGSWSNYYNRNSGENERQFHFNTYHGTTPHGRSGIVRYLERAPSIGRVIAARLFDLFGQDAVRVLKEQPDVAAGQIERLGEEGAHQAAIYLKEQEQLQESTIDMIDLLDGKGFPKNAPKKAIKIWGNNAAAIIRRDPYKLMGRIRGCGFKLCDTLYLQLGGDPSALKRQALCAWYGVRQAMQSGDTWHFVGVVEKALRGSIGGADVQLDDAMRLATRGRILSRLYTTCREGGPSWDGTVQWVADSRKARNEAALAASVAEAYLETNDNLVESAALTEHQSRQLSISTKSDTSLGILGGSPGTGKSYTACEFIRALVAAGHGSHIAVAAPTGKASVRMSELMAAAKLPLRATTIHSLLGVASADSHDGWGFKHGRDNPLPFRFLIIDEFSMVDTDLAASLFAARAPGTFMLCVGDVNQLAPVGHGAPLRDMILAGVPYGELRDIHRNDGGIVQACADMRDGKEFTCNGNLIHRNGGDLHVEMIRILEETRRDGLDPVWDCQVMCAVNKKSDMSRATLNDILQKHLNANPVLPGSPFRLRDKVICIKNGWYPPSKPKQECVTNDRGEIYVANGDLGRVVGIEAKKFEIVVQAPERHIIVPRGAATEKEDDNGESTGTGTNWELAYAVSCHKMQGAQAEVGIVMIDDGPGARWVCDRAWHYTAYSRAKQKTYIVGNLNTAHADCRKVNISKRKTFLHELIEMNLAAL